MNLRLKKQLNNRLDPTGNNADLVLAQAGCPGGSAETKGGRN